MTGKKPLTEGHVKDLQKGNYKPDPSKNIKPIQPPPPPTPKR
jgi:hypothetical protein